MTLDKWGSSEQSARRDVPNRSLRILCPNGHLGFAPIKIGSFEEGVRHQPDLIAADSGSCDVGPVPLACDISCSPYKWQVHDIERMVVAGRALGVPVIIGSAGDTGTNSQVDKFVNAVRDIAERHELPSFKLGYFYSEVKPAEVRERLRSGVRIEGLDGRSDLTEADLSATDRIVAVAGVHPYMDLLRKGADVIIGGRSSDAAIFAAPALLQGYPEDLAYFYGKVLECSSFCAEPFAGKESVIGEISDQDIRVTPMLHSQRCTVASVAGHAMYERANPFVEHFVGGTLDMSDCHYEQFDARTVRITGSRFRRISKIKVKLEGAGKVGERFVGLVAVRDPYTIENIDTVIQWSRTHVRETFGLNGYELHYSVIGRDAILGRMEPVQKPAHEVGICVQAVARDRARAEEICMTAVRQLFYARLPDVKGTAGGVAFPFDEVMQTKPACRWTLNHVMDVDDPMQLFPTYMIEISASRKAAEVRA